MLKRVSSVPIVGLVSLLLVTLRCILEGVGCGFVSVVLVAGLLVLPVLVGYTELVRGMRLTLILLNTLLTLLLLLFSSFRRRIKSVADALKGIRQRGFSQRQGWMLCTGIGLLSVDRDLVGPLLRWSLGVIGSLLIYMVFPLGLCRLLRFLISFVSQVVIARRDSRLLWWSNWLKEDLRSRPYAQLRPDFVPPSHFLVVKDTDLGTS